MEDGCVYDKLGSLFLFTPPQKHFYQKSVPLSLFSLLSSLCLSGGKVLLRISPIVYSSPKIAWLYRQTQSNEDDDGKLNSETAEK